MSKASNAPKPSTAHLRICHNPKGYVMRKHLDLILVAGAIALMLAFAAYVYFTPPRGLSPAP